MNNSESFVCFYTTQPFWATEKPDLNIIKQEAKLFYDTLSEEIIKHDNDVFSIKICKDGLIMVQIHELERDRKTTNSDLYYNNESRLIIPDIAMMSKYISYLNVIQLLLDSAILKARECRCFSVINLGSG